MILTRLSTLAAAAALALAAALPAAATDLSFGGLAASARATSNSLPTLQPWMNPEIRGAWQQGFFGQNTTITVIDDFQSSQRFSGNLGTGVQRLRHGEWTAIEAHLIAPRANIVAHSFYSNRAVALRPGLNTLNLSYGMMGRAGLSATRLRWGAQEASIIDHARRGAAIVVKAAGNDAVAVGAANRQGQVDYLNSALVGTAGTIFVGALTHNGTTGNKARLASYSNSAGSNRTVQQNFLAVGVPGNLTGLHGTSFAAPVVAGYAAVLGSKFRTASPTQIKSQLLNTARTDTIHGYNPALHGRGEASIARALAPVRIR